MIDDIGLEGWDANLKEEDAEYVGLQKLVLAHNKKKQTGGFQSMGLSKHILKGIQRKGYKIPTPIQRRTIPLILEGKDVVAMARTGSGKTAAFLIPLFEKLKLHTAKVGARALILSPTRELAMQTLNFAKALGKFTGLRAACILGGESIEGQFAALHENPDIIIATPKRFKHVLIEMNIRLDSVEYLVFDEVDRLFEMKFTDQMKYILSCLPSERQTLLFSATLPKVILEFARVGLTDPILIRLDVDTKVSENLKMGFFRVNSEDKLPLLLHLLKNVVPDHQWTVIFTPTKHHVEYIHKILEEAGIMNTYIYSSLDPAARKTHMAKFRSGRVHLLVVTDVAARGLDIPMLDNVINFNFPDKAKLFVHRVGRVARAGRCGTAYSFVAPDESVYLLELHMFLNRSISLAPYPLPGAISDCDRMYGRVPQDILDDNTDYVNKLIQFSSDLQDKRQAATNSLKKYMKSRSNAAPETNRRLKEELWDQNLGFHPLLVTGKKQDEELERLHLLEKLKNLRPKATIFEIKDGKKGQTMSKASFMEEKRRVDQYKIDNFHQKMQKRMALKTKKQKQEQLTMKQRGNLAKSDEVDILMTFNTVIGKGRIESDADAADKDPSSVSTSQISGNSDHFIPYYSGDVHEDKGYSIFSSFQRETAEAAFDVLGDEDKALDSRQIRKWDRKRKKFVSVDQPKKILTESGVWVEASYKKNLYEKWKQKMLVEQNQQKDDDDDEGALRDEEQPKNNVSKKRRGTTFVDLSESCKNRPHPLMQGKKQESVKISKKGPRQLKTFDQRMKFLKEKAQRRKKEKFLQERKKKKKNKKKSRAEKS